MDKKKLVYFFLFIFFSVVLIFLGKSALAEKLVIYSTSELGENRQITTDREDSNVAQSQLCLDEVMIYHIRKARMENSPQDFKWREFSFTVIPLSDRNQNGVVRVSFSNNLLGISGDEIINPKIE